MFLKITMERSSKGRSCTDITPLILFVVTVACWIVLGVYALLVGRPYLVLLPKDTIGHACGVDHLVKRKPYLFFFDIAACEDEAVPLAGCNFTHICVRDCPSHVFFSNNPTDVKHKTLYCLYNTNKWDPTKCAKWYLPSYSYERKCIPFDTYYTNETVLKRITEIREQETTSEKFESAVKNIKQLHQVREISQTVLYDIMNSWWRILIGVLLAVAICLLYILILCTKPLFVIWFTVVTAMIFICLCLIFSILQYVTYKNSTGEMLRTKANLWLSSIIISSLILGYVLTPLIFSRKSLLNWINLNFEGVKIFKKIPTVWLPPLLVWFIQTLLIIYTFSVGVHLATAGKPVYRLKFLSDSCKSYLAAEFHWIVEEGSECELELYEEAVLKEGGSVCSTTNCNFVGIDRTDFHPYLQAFNIIVFVWMINFIFATEKMTMGVMFSKWYYSINKDQFSGMFMPVTVALRYHLGTLVVGSAPIVLHTCFLIKASLLAVDEKQTQVAFWILMFCIWFIVLFFEIYLTHVTSCAYIFCGLHGHSFCKSSRESYDLISRHSDKFDRLTLGFLMFLIQLWITIVTGTVSYVLFTSSWIIDNSSLSYPFVIVIIIMICAYWTSLAFFLVNRIAVDAIFLCVLGEYEGNNAIKDEDYQAPIAIVHLFKN